MITAEEFCSNHSKIVRGFVSCDECMEILSEKEGESV